jgi:hypothetical protein
MAAVKLVSSVSPCFIAEIDISHCGFNVSRFFLFQQKNKKSIATPSRRLAT